MRGQSVSKGRITLNTSIKKNIYFKFKEVCKKKYPDKFIYESIDEALNLFIEKNSSEEDPEEDPEEELPF